jgi:hypothetical protein
LADLKARYKREHRTKLALVRALEAEADVSEARVWNGSPPETPTLPAGGTDQIPSVHQIAKGKTT